MNRFLHALNGNTAVPNDALGPQPCAMWCIFAVLDRLVIHCRDLSPRLMIDHPESTSEVEAKNLKLARAQHVRRAVEAGGRAVYII